MDSCKYKFICEICDKIFTINQRKNRHIQQVHGEKTRSDEVKCDVCGKSFTASSSLKNTSSLFLEDKALWMWFMWKILHYITLSEATHQDNSWRK